MNTKLIIVVIDGCRPDALEPASTPNLDRIIASGSSTLAVTTAAPPITLPCHLSIFSSRSPIGHGVTTNTATPVIASGTFTLFEAAHYSGLSSASFYSWEHLRNLTPPGVLDRSTMVNTLEMEDGDLLIAGIAAEYLRSAQPDLCFVYLEGTDIAGHRHGWMSDTYIDALSTADRALGIITETMAAMPEAGYNILVTSDHGGVDTHHMTPLPEVMTVFLAGAGARIRANHRIAAQASTLDITPTAAALLGIARHRNWEGSVISEMVAAEK